jgi:integrase
MAESQATDALARRPRPIKAPAKPTGYVRTIERKDGPVYYAKLKLPDGTQPQRRLGKVWMKRTAPPPGFLNERQAQARLEAILAGDDPLVNVAPSHVTFKAACDERLRYVEHDRQRKRSTVNDYRNVINHDLVPFFGESTPIEDVTTERVDEFKDHLLARKRGRGEETLSHRTAQKVLVILYGVMTRAKRKGWITTNPCENAEKVTVRRSDEFNVLSVEQVHAVAREAATDLLCAMFLTAAFTGLRMGELLALRWRHVDFANRIVHVLRNYVEGVEDTPKSHRRRSVPLSDQAAVALDALSRREHFAGPDDLVFGDQVGEHSDDDAIRDAFYDALEAAGLGQLREKDDPIIFHDLRHTFGTQCAAKGIDLRRVQAWMGHADIQTTMKYLHYVPAHDDAARLTAAFAPESVHPTVHRTADIGA